MKVVILAGGQGRRLRPYTAVLPKPLLPVGEVPILEILIRRLKNQGIYDFVISVGYLGSLIEAYLGDGNRLGVNISYLREDKPLGTVGPLKLMEDPKEPFLVMNGDILTDIDFTAFAKFHQQHGQRMTIATYSKEVKIDLGVLEIDDSDGIVDYIEKPTMHRPVSMGIYCCDPSVRDFIPVNSYFDLPTLVLTLISNGQPVKAFRHNGYWLDIGRHEDYQSAQDNITQLTQNEPA